MSKELDTNLLGVSPSMLPLANRCGNNFPKPMTSYDYDGDGTHRLIQLSKLSLEKYNGDQVQNYLTTKLRYVCVIVFIWNLFIDILLFYLGFKLPVS